jgi:hypothetical protein
MVTPEEKLRELEARFQKLNANLGSAAAEEAVAATSPAPSRFANLMGSQQSYTPTNPAHSALLHNRGSSTVTVLEDSATPRVLTIRLKPREPEYEKLDGTITSNDPETVSAPILLQEYGEVIAHSVSLIVGIDFSELAAALKPEQTAQLVQQIRESGASPEQLAKLTEKIKAAEDAQVEVAQASAEVSQRLERLRSLFQPGLLTKLAIAGGIGLAIKILFFAAPVAPHIITHLPPFPAQAAPEFNLSGSSNTFVLALFAAVAHAVGRFFLRR